MSFLTSPAEFYVSMDSQKRKGNLYTKYQRLRNIPKVSIIFIVFSIILVVFQTLHVIVNIIYDLVFDHSYSTLVFQGAILIWTGFVSFFCFNAVYLENEFQLFAVLVTTFVMAICSIANGIWKVKDILEAIITGEIDLFAIIPLLIIVILSTLGILSCALFVTIFVYPVYKSFGWRMFKYIGGNIKLIRYFKIYLAFKTIFKLDVCLSLILWYLHFMLVPTGVGGRNFIELILIYSGLGIGLIIQLTTYFYMTYTTKKEFYIFHIIGILSNLWLPIVYIIIYIVALVYAFNPHIDGFGNPWKSDCNVQADKCNYGVDELYTYLIIGLLTFINLFSKFLTIFMACCVMFNFRKGLKTTYKKVTNLTSTESTQDLNDIEKIFAKGRQEKARKQKHGTVMESFDIEDDDFDMDDDNNSLFDDL